MNTATIEHQEQTFEQWHTHFVNSERDVSAELKQTSEMFEAMQNAPKACNQALAFPPFGKEQLYVKWAEGCYVYFLDEYKAIQRMKDATQDFLFGGIEVGETIDMFG